MGRNRKSGKPLVILDGAHNPSAMQTLVDELRSILAGRALRVVLGAMRDKDWRGMWAALQPLTRDVITTEPTLPRALDANVLAEATGRVVPTCVVRPPRAAIAEALRRATSEDAILVTGSLVLVGNVYPHFLGGHRRGHLFEPWYEGAADVRQAPA